MLRNDGEWTVYLVQHRHDDEDEWHQSDLGYFLFHHMPYEEKRGTKGAYYRLLIDPTHVCWQATSVSAFLDMKDAQACFTAILAERQNRNSDREPSFRLVRRRLWQETEEVVV
jgi:hypothetical protein